MQEEEKKEFVCSKCGCCCKHVNCSEDSIFLDRGDGTCKYFDEKTNLCNIYDFRPDICRVDKVYKRYKNKMTWNQYVDLNYASCEQLREVEKAIKNRKEYPNKLRYDDVLSKDDEIIDDSRDENNN